MSSVCAVFGQELLNRSCHRPFENWFGLFSRRTNVLANRHEDKGENVQLREKNNDIKMLFFRCACLKHKIVLGNG